MPHDEAQDKRDELTNLVAMTLNLQDSEKQIVAMVVESFSAVKPPEVAGLNDVGLIRMGQSFSAGALSIKPGNILLNWRKLLIDGSDSILIGVGAVSSPLLIPLSALVIWSKLRNIGNVELSSRHAAVILTMWKNRDGKNRIDPNEVLSLTNLGLSELKQPLMSKDELEVIFLDLERMKCIELNNGKYWLREWVRVPYN